MGKKLSTYKLIIFDMDGTLYFQRPLQLHMGMKMLFACASPKGLKEMKIVLRFRKMREHWKGAQEKEDASDIDHAQYRELARELGLRPEEIEKIIHKWIYHKPLEIIEKYRDDKLAELIKTLVKQKKKVVIYSDYPAEDKRNALKLPDIDCFYGGQREIACMKPDPKGIATILSHYQIQNPKEALMIGDRMSRDGQAAINAGIDFFILKRHRFQRRSQYKTLFSA